MGFAKYLEDDIGIFNDRMYMKGLDGFKELREMKNESEKIKAIISPEKEYMMILNELSRLDVWLNIINEIYQRIGTNFVVKMLDNQKKQLVKVKDEYINYIYDLKFKNYRNNKKDSDKKELETYRLKIMESYIEYFIEKLKGMNNHDDHDAIEIDNLYWDIGMFVETVYLMDTKSLDIPLAQFLREKILKDGGHEWVICSNCGANTYLDFNSCIRCKYPKGVV